MAQAADFERLGSFYLGRQLRADGSVGPEPLLYEARDLTTHAVCLGMTGSGKTGLCVSLLEEAAIDGIPAIAIEHMALVWRPYWLGADGQARPAFA